MHGSKVEVTGTVRIYRNKCAQIKTFTWNCPYYESFSACNTQIYFILDWVSVERLLLSIHSKIMLIYVLLPHTYIIPRNNYWPPTTSHFLVIDISHDLQIVIYPVMWLSPCLTSNTTCKIHDAGNCSYVCYIDFTIWVYLFNTLQNIISYGLIALLYQFSFYFNASFTF